MGIKYSRVWAMPNKWTFLIPPIAQLLARYVVNGKGWIDPFAGENSPAEITNDPISELLIQAKAELVAEVLKREKRTVRK